MSERDLSELTTHCVHCGFCLEACPTFQVTRNEVESPRGRIYLVRSALEGQLRWQEDVREHLDLCLGCRACETACPSGVHYGAILELARDRMEQQSPRHTKTALLKMTTSPGMLKTNLALGKLLPSRKVPGPLSWLLSRQPAEADQPTAQTPADLPPQDEAQLPPVIGEVYLLEGCAMRVLYPRVHQATRRLLRRVGYTVREVEQGCCGAMHAHAGHLGEAKQMASHLVATMSEDLPVVVNSAGCGSTMKEYGELIGEPGEAFAKRTFDVSEFLHSHGLGAVLARSSGVKSRVTYHDACHLSHGQKVRTQPRELLKAIPGIEFVELPESEMCCGSAGIYNVVQPKMARDLVERKFGNIELTEATLVVTGNPGCHGWIAQATKEHGGRVTVLHTVEMLEAAFVGIEYFAL